MKLTGENRSTRGKTCPSATLSTTNPTGTDPGSNPGLRGGRPATNRLSRGTANNTVGFTLHFQDFPSYGRRPTITTLTRIYQQSSRFSCWNPGFVFCYAVWGFSWLFSVPPRRFPDSTSNYKKRFFPYYVQFIISSHPTMRRCIC
jgi:hypothetical protein